MSARQFFLELEAVASVLDEYVTRQNHKDNSFKRLTEEEFTAVWQAVELLVRSHNVLLPFVQLDQAKGYLNIADPMVLPDDVSEDVPEVVE